MAMRQMTKALQPPTEALIWFPLERASSVVRVKKLQCSEGSVAVGKVVGYVHNGKTCPAKILALSSKYYLKKPMNVVLDTMFITSIFPNLS